MNARTAIVTGASRGIGVYIARELAARGLNLLLVARSEQELLRVADELRGHGSTIAVAAVDLADRDAARRIVEAAARELGPVDVLVNNAAIELQRRFHLLDVGEIETALRVDLIAPIELSRLLVPQMLERGYGRIVNISSLAGHVGFPFTEAYAAAKDGLIAFGRVLRNDYRGSGVSASTLVLGAVRDTGVGQRTLDLAGAVGPAAGRDRRGVGASNGVDAREAEAEPVGVGRAVGVQALERPEEPSQLGRRDLRAGVRHREGGAAGPRVGFDRDA